MPAPPGNLNAFKTGQQLRKRGLPSCRLPSGCAYIDRRVDGWRCRVEEELIKAGVILTRHAESILNEACDAEKARQYLFFKLRDSESQPLGVIMELTKSIRECARQRNACLNKLFPATSAAPDAVDPWESFDRAAQLPPTPQNASDATSEPHSVPGSGPGEWRAD